MEEIQNDELDITGTKEDELPGYSQDDIAFLNCVIPPVRQRPDKMIEFPLPFRKSNPVFPYNRKVALARTRSTLENMRRKHPEIFQSSLDKFAKNLDLLYPRFVPVPNEYRHNTNGQAYWIPLFSVWQKGKARIVFDSAAKTQNICLNDMLLQGPDRNNSLRGVLLRFRLHPHAVTADIENMFHQIAIPDHQRTYMRFFWYEDNDPAKDIIEYWSNVQLMGCTHVPSVANLAVRYAARENPPTNGKRWMEEDNLLNPYQSQRTRIPDDIERTLSQQFYVDDLLASAKTPEAALNLISEGIRRLDRYELKLLKVQSNSAVIRDAYPTSTPLPTTRNLTPMDNSSPNPSMGQSLGLQWDTQQDEFMIKMEYKERPQTKRGFLGYVMSPYDPFGMASPAMLSCKLLQRDIFPPKERDPHNFQTLGWDDPIPQRFDRDWQKMIKTIRDVQHLKMTRSFYPSNSGTPTEQQLFAFADASDLALCYVIYLRTITTTGSVFLSFVCGSTKVLPKGTTFKGELSIPRAELCAADALALQVLQVEKEIDIPRLKPTQYFSDSEDVLSWIRNTTENFKRYITSRRNRICKIASSEQWQRIPTQYNPADIGTRPISVDDLQKSEWLTGPAFLKQNPYAVPIGKQEIKILKPTIETQAKLATYFLTQTRPMNEEITTGRRWTQLLDSVKNEDPSLDNKSATRSLELKMQQEVWPKGLQTIQRLENVNRARILCTNPGMGDTIGIGIETMGTDT